MTQGKIGWRSFVSSTTSSTDTDAQAFITAAGITDSVQQSAITTLVADLKSYGLWTKMKSIYPFVGGSAASHKWNLKDPRDLDAAFRLAFSGGGTHNNYGYVGNSTNGYANTFVIPSTDLSTTSIHISYYSQTDTVGASKIEIGSAATSRVPVQLYVRYSSTTGIGYLFQPSAGSFTVSTGKRYTIVSRTTSNSVFVMNNNSLTTLSQTVSGISPTNSPLYINATSSNNAPSSGSYSDKTSSFVTIGDGLTEAECSNLYISVQKFQTTLGRHVGTPYVSDPDAVAFLMAAGITDGTQAAAINTLVIRMKADGVWTKMKAIYPFVGGSATSHKWNLKDPRDLDAAYRLTFSGGWTHTSTGAKPNGTTGYANTYLNPKNNLATNSGLGVYSRTNDTSKNQADMGAMYYFPVQAFIIGNGTSLGVFMGSNSSDFISFAETDTKAFYQVYRTDSTTVKSLRNTTSYSNTNLPYSAPNLNVYIGARNEMGIAQDFGLREVAFAYMQENFTDVDALNLYSTVQEFQTTLGRQVNVPKVSDTDAQAFLNAANITSFQQASAVNKLVVDLKAAGIWTKMKAIYPFVGGSASSHKFNLKDPRDLDAAFRLVFFGGGTHGNSGYLLNGSNSWANTYFTPSVNWTVAGKSSFGLYSTTNNTLSGRISMGTQQGNGWVLLYLKDGTSNYALNNTNWSSFVGPVDSSNDKRGFFQSSRNNSTTTQLYSRNNNNYSANSVYTGVSNIPIFIGTMNGSTNSYVENVNVAFSYIGEDLSATDMSNYYTVIQAFQTALGRHVDTPIYNNSLVLNLDAGNANSYPGTGTTWFDLASGNNGTLVNGPTYDATNGGSIVFDGVNDRITSFPTKLPDTSSKTIDVWFRTTSTVRQGLCGTRDGVNVTGWVFTINRTSTGNLTYFHTGQGTIEISAGITTNTWYNAVLTHDYSTGTSKIYLNGKLLGTGNASGYNSSTFNGVIGDEDGSFTTPFKGNIPKVTMYNRVLTDTEVLNNFNSTRGRFGL